ncbi:MAG: LptF/LptG family permease, partial [Sphingobacteriaceae bacterium]
MKKIHKLILKAFIQPFFVTFFIVMFVLLMLFLFKYIDDLIGKGFEWYVILELMMYASATNVAMALPLSILLSSIMTFGSLGENYELVAIKS